MYIYMCEYIWINIHAHMHSSSMQPRHKRRHSHVIQLGIILLYVRDLGELQNISHRPSAALHCFQRFLLISCTRQLVHYINGTFYPSDTYLKTGLWHMQTFHINYTHEDLNTNTKQTYTHTYIYINLNIDTIYIYIYINRHKNVTF